MPEDLVVLAAGALAHQGVVRWWIALPLCLAGVLSGDVLLYWVARRWGERVLELRMVRLVLSRGRAEAFMAGYRRHGAKIVFTARHIVGLRAAAVLTAGIARVPFWRFLAVDAAAASLSVPFGFALAFVFADQLQEVIADFRRVQPWLALVALVAIATWAGYASWRRRRRF